MTSGMIFLLFSKYSQSFLIKHHVYILPLSQHRTTVPELGVGTMAHFSWSETSALQVGTVWWGGGVDNPWSFFLVLLTGNLHPTNRLEWGQLRPQYFQPIMPGTEPLPHK